jgi:hypothetical protein
LKLRYTDFPHHHALAQPPDLLRQEMFEVVSDLLKRNLAQGRAVRLLGVSASALLSTGWQEPLLHRERRKSFEKLYQGIDNLRRKYGEDAVGAATPRTRTS